jgi:phage repressor protein C with HTH and peptisase S24 domain
MTVLRLLGLRLARVCGHSMAPTIPDGAYVLLRTYGRRRRPRPGDICMFRSDDERRMIKRLTRQTDEGRFSLRGDGALSAPEIDLGSVAEQDMLGRVLFVIRPHGVRTWPFPPNSAAWGRISPDSTNHHRSIKT